MADLTPGTITPGHTCRAFYYDANASVAAGEIVRIGDGSEVIEADATTNFDAKGIVVSVASGIALVVTRGPVDIGTTITKGTMYVLSDTAGKICLYSDLGTGDTVVMLGVAVDTSTIEFDINNTGIVK